MDERKQIEWDSQTYDEVSNPQFNWGLKVLERAELRGDETVMDAGCGSGRLTAELLRRLPNGRVFAVDSSENMLRTAHERLGGESYRLNFVHADLANLPLVREVDGIFSNAVFHWVPDHDALFHSLFRALKPGGWLLAQFGGRGNLQRLHDRLLATASQDAFKPYLNNWSDDVHFEDEIGTRARLETAGFVEIHSELFSSPIQFPNVEAMTRFVRTVNAHQIISRLPAGIEDAFLAAALAESAHDTPPFTLDYVRLNVFARKPHS